MRSEALVKAQTKYVLSRKRLVVCLLPSEWKMVKDTAKKAVLTYRQLVMKLVTEYRRSL